MSWALSTVGSKMGVKNAIDKEAHIPPTVKDAMKSVVDALPDNPKRVVTLETNGHIDAQTTHEYSGGNVSLKIGMVTLTD